MSIDSTIQMESMMAMVNVKSIVWVVMIWAATRWLVVEMLLRARKRLPPGPFPLPIIGNLHNMSKKPHHSMAELAKIHGPLMLLKFGMMKTVVVTSPEMAQQILQKKHIHFSDRTVADSLHACQHEGYSIPLIPFGDRWRTVRRIASTQLFSNNSLDANQHIRMKKVEDLVSYIRTCTDGTSGVAVNIGHLICNTSINVLSSTFFSIDMADPDSELSREFKQIVWFVVRDAGIPNIVDFFPVLKFLDPQGIRRRMTSHFQRLFGIFDTIIEKRMADRRAGVGEHNDVLDSLLKICEDKSEEFEFRQIRHMLLDLFVAGAETTSSTVEWAMAELLNDPSKLKKAQEELHHVIGRGKFVRESDFARLPYLEAVVKENFRIHPPLPLLFPRKAGCDTEVGGLIVPKDSQVLINVWAMGRDPALWENPRKFEPERFLGLDTDVKGKHFELIPFGGGRRICLGMSLANRTIHLMLGTLLHFFEWELGNGVAPGSVDMEEKFGAALQKATPLFAVPKYLDIMK